MSTKHKSENNNQLLINKITISVIAFIVAIVIKDFKYISLGSFIFSYLVIGYNVIYNAFKELFKGHILNDNFIILIASIGAFALKIYIEAVAVMFLFQVGKFFQTLSVSYINKAIKNMIDIRPKYTTIYKNGKLTKVKPQNVHIGDIIIVKSGEIIPLDGVVKDGRANVNTAILDDEPSLIQVTENCRVSSGWVNTTGTIKIKTVNEFEDSTLSQLYNIINNACLTKSKTEQTITKFTKIYTPVIFVVAVLTALIPTLVFNFDLYTWLYRSLVILAVSCSTSLLISIPLIFYSSLSVSFKHGIIYKNSNSLNKISNLGTIVFDKTGTLTSGIFKIQNVITKTNCTKDNILRFAAYAEYYSSHPIATCIKNEYKNDIDKDCIKNFKEHKGLGVSATISDNHVVIGNAKLMKEFNINFIENKEIGTKVYIAINYNFAGVIILYDEIKQDSINTIEKLKNLKLNNIIMLTGDSKEITNNVSNIIGIKKFYSNLSPENKLVTLEHLKKIKHKNTYLAFLSSDIDNLNLLEKADIGVLFRTQNNNLIKHQSSNIVMFSNKPSKIIATVKISRFTNMIVKENVTLALVLKLLTILLGTLGLITLWLVILIEIVVSLLLIVNSIRVLKHKY